MARSPNWSSRSTRAPQASRAAPGEPAAASRSLFAERGRGPEARREALEGEAAVIPGRDPYSLARRALALLQSLALLRWRAALRLVAADAAVVVTGVVVYFGVRGLTAGSPETARAHAADILALEKTLGLDIEAGAQALLVDVAPLTTLANWIYIWGHWPVIVGTLIWLALHNRRVFLRLRNAMIASGALGLCVYTTYPVAPPRLMGGGFVDTITEQSNSYRVLQPPAFVNQYAAMPSLHVGWDLCVGLALLAAASTLIMRTIGRVMPAAMAAATLLTANHYVLDILVGAAFGLAGWAIALQLEHRRDRRAALSGPNDPQVLRPALTGPTLSGPALDPVRAEASARSSTPAAPSRRSGAP